MIRKSWFLSQGNDNYPNLLFVRRWLCHSNCYCCNWVLHVVLPPTSNDLYSDSQCLRAFFWLFLLQNAWKSSDIWEISISRLLWSDQWKLHGEIQRHTRPAEIFTYLKTRILLSARLVVSVPESVYFWRNSDKRFPYFTRQQKWPKLYRDE